MLVSYSLLVSGSYLFKWDERMEFHLSAWWNNLRPLLTSSGQSVQLQAEHRLNYQIDPF